MATRPLFWGSPPLIDTGNMRGNIAKHKRGCQSRVTLNHRVVGSIPTQPTERFKELSVQVLLTRLSEVIGFWVD